LFGNIVDGQMKSNRAGEAIERWWLELPRKFPTVATDEFVIMPNHIHGIIIITVGADLRVGLTTARTGAHAGRQGADGGPTHRSAPTGAPRPTIVQWFKTMSTNEYMRDVKNLGWTPFRGQLWQRGYYEHVIRDEESLNRIRQYILDNPARWAYDRENPAPTALNRVVHIRAR
jgi:REP element-mobilizing transposase RayT